MTLRDLQTGESAVILTVGGSGALRQHFLDMGMIPGVEVTLVKYAPMGDPMELRLHGYELTLRLADAEQIEIEEVQKAGAEHEASKAGKDGRLKQSGRFTDHPGLGEGGKYHEKETEHPLPDGTTLTFALAGNQNCGKTTLFNQLTGANQHVGNFPGVTVDRKSGVIRGHEDTLVTDLPGIYSLSPYTSEEIVSRQFILEEKPNHRMEYNAVGTMQSIFVPGTIIANWFDVKIYGTRLLKQLSFCCFQRCFSGFNMTALRFPCGSFLVPAQNHFSMALGKDDHILVIFQSIYLVGLTTHNQL